MGFTAYTRPAFSFIGKMKTNGCPHRANAQPCRVHPARDRVGHASANQVIDAAGLMPVVHSKLDRVASSLTVP